MNQKAKSSKSRSERSHGSQPAHVKSILTSIYEIRSTLEMPKAIKKFSRVDLDLFDYELHQLVQILRSWRNAKQPVNSLPAEILATIFGHCQYPLRDYLPFPLNSPAPLHREWRNLTRVCRLWRHISRECAPQLWSTIDLNVSPRTFLHRSGKAPLTIYAGIREPWTPSAQAIKVLNKHASRITEFHVSSPPGDSSAVFHALASLQDPASNLRSLTLEVSLPPVPHTSVQMIPAIFADQFPSLKKVCLKHYTPSYSMRNLTHVCLYDQPMGRETMDNFSVFLRASPRLRELTLVNAGPDYPQLDHWQDSASKVDMLHLRELVIGAWSSPQSVSHFLERLWLPSATKLFIWSTEKTWDFSVCIPEKTKHLRNMADADTWSINRETWPRRYTAHQWLDTDLCLLAVEDGVLYLRGQHSATTIWGCIGRFGLHQSISKICIRERRSDQRLSVHDWTQAFRMLDSVEAVEIFDYSDEPQGYNWAQTDQSSQTILEALTPRKGGLSQTTGRHIFGLQSRKKASGAEIVVPCPRLDALEIHHDHLFRIVQLQSLVARRGQCGYKLEELELIHHEMTIPGYGAAGPSAFSRQDVATLEEFVTDISLSRQHVVEKLVKVQHSPPPIPHPPWDPQSPPPQPHYISPTVSAESLTAVESDGKRRPVLGQVPQYLARETDKEPYPLLPPSWPTESMKWTSTTRESLIPG